MTGSSIEILDQWDPATRFQVLRHTAGTLMHEAGVPLKRAQEIFGHAGERTTLSISTHSIRRSDT
jgi:hypothetical protein